MAHVNKCDICGEIYDTRDEKTVMGFCVYENGCKDDYRSMADHVILSDCCPECTERILSFITVMKTSKKYTG